ncbi:hypothetical protein ABIB90_007475 [Bradyrhizobium sp. JR4.1]
MADDSEGDGGQQVGYRSPLRRTASKRGSRVIRLVGRRSRKPENLAARPLGRHISRKLIERFASLSLAKLVNSRRSRLPCAVRAWPRSEATSKLKVNLSRACGLPSAKSVQEMSNCLTRGWSTSRCTRHEETVIKGRAFVRPSSKSTPDDILTDVWDRTLSLSGTCPEPTQCNVSGSRPPAATAHPRSSGRAAPPANLDNRAIRRDLEFLRQMLRRLS